MAQRSLWSVCARAANDFESDDFPGFYDWKTYPKGFDIFFIVLAETRDQAAAQSVRELVRTHGEKKIFALSISLQGYEVMTGDEETRVIYRVNMGCSHPEEGGEEVKS